MVDLRIMYTLCSYENTSGFGKNQRYEALVGFPASYRRTPEM